MKLKRLFIVGLAIVIVLALASCGGGKDAPAQNTGNSDAPAQTETEDDNAADTS